MSRYKLSRRRTSIPGHYVFSSVGLACDVNFKLAQNGREQAESLWPLGCSVYGKIRSIQEVWICGDPN